MQTGRSAVRLAFCLAAPLIAARGCDGPYAVGALHWPYLSSDLASDNRLLGTWAANNDTLTFIGRNTGRYLMGNFSRRAGDSAGSGGWPPIEVKLLRFGEVEVMDWGGYGLEGDLSGAQVFVPLRVMFSADTMWLLDIEPDDLPDDSTLATDSINWIDRGNVRFLRGPGERVRQLLDRFLFDTLALEGFERYVRVPMGQGPDAPPEEARRD